MELKCHPTDAQEFVSLGDEFGTWLRRQMDMLGGWLPGIEDIYRPKTYGYFGYNKTELEKFERITKAVAETYVNVGKALLRGEHALAVTQELLPQQEVERLKASFANGSIAPTTIRADVVFDEVEHPKIVEVNTDNVAGLENLFLYHSFFGNRVKCQRVHEEIGRSKERLVKCVREWLEAHYEVFRTKRAGQELPELKKANIVVVYDDRDHCFFLARVMAEILRQLGYRAEARRPENLQVMDGRIVAKRPLSKEMDTVHVIWRHWLFFEMFDSEGNFRREFEPIAVADAEGLALVLNPIKDRLLFSKSIIALLLDPRSSLYGCAHREFRALVADSKLVELDNSVVKPLSKFGGEGVLIGERGARLIQQERVRTGTVGAWYRRSEGVKRADLYVVHGVLIYVTPDGTGHLGGIMGRGGPGRVVNFSQGAQVFGTLTPLDIGEGF